MAHMVHLLVLWTTVNLAKHSINDAWQFYLSTALGVSFCEVFIIAISVDLVVVVNRDTFNCVLCTNPTMMSIQVTMLVV